MASSQVDIPTLNGATCAVVVGIARWLREGSTSPNEDQIRLALDGLCEWRLREELAAGTVDIGGEVTTAYLGVKASIGMVRDNALLRDKHEGLIDAATYHQRDMAQRQKHHALFDPFQEGLPDRFLVWGDLRRPDPWSRVIVPAWPALEPLAIELSGVLTQVGQQ